MEAYVTPVLIVSLVLILAIVIYSTRKVARLDRLNTPGLIKPIAVIRGVQFVLLIAFGVTAYLMTQRAFALQLGFALLAALFVLWVPFQFWQSARLLLDETKAVYYSPLGHVTELLWQEVREARVDQTPIELHSEKSVLRVPRWISDPARVRKLIEKYVAGQNK